ncbi:hypothetical protein ACFSHQ_08220 [Gemmobacter lanyuensis]
MAAALWVAAFGMDRGRDWIAATDLPSLTLATSTEVVDRGGILLRAYTVADGRWRMAVTPDAVDPVISPCWSPMRTSGSGSMAGWICGRLAVPWRRRSGMGGWFRAARP